MINCLPSKVLNKPPNREREAKKFSGLPCALQRGNVQGHVLAIGMTSIGFSSRIGQEEEVIGFSLDSRIARALQSADLCERISKGLRNKTLKPLLSKEKPRCASRKRSAEAFKEPWKKTLSCRKLQKQIKKTKDRKLSFGLYCKASCDLLPSIVHFSCAETSNSWSYLGRSCPRLQLASAEPEGRSR